MICKFDGCENVLWSGNSSGYCRNHRPKDDDTGTFIKIEVVHTICSYASCETILGVRNSSGYCRSHRPRQTEKICLFEGCETSLGESNQSGYCEKHARVASVLAIRGRLIECSYSGCQNLLTPENTTGLCISHTQYVLRRVFPPQTTIQRRRDRERIAFVEYVDLQIVWERDEGVCCLCNEPADPNDWWEEHLIPISRGGPHCYDNVAVSHPECNRRKHDKTMEEYHEWLSLKEVSDA